MKTSQHRTSRTCTLAAAALGAALAVPTVQAMDGGADHKRLQEREQGEPRSTDADETGRAAVRGYSERDIEGRVGPVLVREDNR